MQTILQEFVDELSEREPTELQTVEAFGEEITKFIAARVEEKGEDEGS